MSLFQSTHPLRGATETDRHFLRRQTYFNPRTPCGVRQRHHHHGRDAHHISIHAPLAGCDCSFRREKRRARHFNPRTPCGVRRLFRRHTMSNVYFNPRTPCGVRRETLLYIGVVQEISIHAPLAGCDPWAGLRPAALSISIHAPLAGCDPWAGLRPAALSISIHAPLAGCDGQGLLVIMQHGISIHAPLAGCDAPACPAAHRRRHFNPRTPCGVRPVDIAPRSGVDQFQSTHPLRGATRLLPGLERRGGYFNPRTPCGVRRALVKAVAVDRDISIHAPLAGCDRMAEDICVIVDTFQSTHPLRGATATKPGGL